MLYIHHVRKKSLESCKVSYGIIVSPPSRLAAMAGLLPVCTRA